MLISHHPSTDVPINRKNLEPQIRMNEIMIINDNLIIPMYICWSNPLWMNVGWIPFGWIHSWANFGPCPAQVLARTPPNIAAASAKYRRHGVVSKMLTSKKTGFLLVDHRFFFPIQMAIFDGASNGERHQSNGPMAILYGQMGYETTPFWDKPAWGSAKTLYMAGCFCFVMQWSQQNIASKSAVESSVDDKRFRNSQKVTHQIIRFA